MIKEAIGVGNTIDEAREDAVKKLNAPAEADVNFDTISFPKKKVMGLFGGSMAEVKAYYEIADKPQKTQKKKQAKPQTKKEKPAKKEEKAPVVKEDTKKELTKSKNTSKKNDEIVYSDPIEESKIEKDSPTGKAIAYIRTVLEKVNCKDVTITVRNRENGSLITLDGEDVSIIIGRRGETLDALQYLASLVANNGGGHYRISLNIGNYREKREETLTELAVKVAEQVLKTGKKRTLEPMNPNERRVIHTAIGEIDGVVSMSFGEGTGRRVIVAPEGAQIRPPRNGSKRKNGRQGSRPKAVQPETPSREPKKDSDIPLYGKIN